MSAAGSAPAVVWFRDDLRIADNPALRAAVDSGRPVVCLFVWDEQSDGLRAPGGAARWWLHHSLTALAGSLETAGASLVVRRGPAERVVHDLLDEVGAGAVYWNRRYGGAERRIDEAIKSAAHDAGLEATSFGANLLFEPWTIRTGSGRLSPSTHRSGGHASRSRSRASPSPRRRRSAPDRPRTRSRSTISTCSPPTRTGRAASARRGSRASAPRIAK